MKLNELIPLLSAIIAAAASFLVGKLNSSSNNEKVYADHYIELLNKIDQLTSERDNLKDQIIKLREQISAQSKIIDELSKQIASLKKKEEMINGFN